jgi:hypothetical protein
VSLDEFTNYFEIPLAALARKGIKYHHSTRANRRSNVHLLFCSESK